MTAIAAATDVGEGAASGVADETATLALRWFRFAAGSTPTEDYRPVGSEGVGLKLLAELAQICVAFHPHNDIRQFPRRRPALLFFRAHSTGDCILLRIGLQSGNAESERLSLEYDGLVLTAADMRHFGLDPFAPGEQGLFDAVRRAATTDAAGARLQATIEPPLRVVPADAEEWTFTSGTERIVSDDEVTAIETLCHLKAARGAAAPFFATWWESGKPVPGGYFDLVLRAPSPRGLSPYAIEEMATHLASDMAYTPEGDAVEDVRKHVVATLRACAQMPPPLFRRAMMEAADELRRIGDPMETQEESDRDLAERCRLLEAELRRLRHPDPFAAGRFDALEAEVREEEKAASAQRHRKRFWRQYRTFLVLASIALVTITLAIVASVYQNRLVRDKIESAGKPSAAHRRSAVPHRAAGPRRASSPSR